jgi:hypothetical protein
MFNFIGENVNDIGAGDMQDIYALIIFGKEYKGTFVDLGCRHPILHNNTYLLEQYGWRGIAVDLDDYTEEWVKSRPNSKYIHKDVFKVDFKKEFDDLELPETIDFLSIDLDKPGSRFFALRKLILTSGRDFKVITIEHDSYYSNNVSFEKIPQRELLTSLGYILVKDCDIIEDFWINPKYIDEDQYEMLIYKNEAIDTYGYTGTSRPYEHLMQKRYDWTHFYQINNLSVHSTY